MLPVLLLLMTVKRDTPGRIQVSQQTPKRLTDSAVQSKAEQWPKEIVNTYFFSPLYVQYYDGGVSWSWRWGKRLELKLSWHNRTGTSQQQGCFHWRGEGFVTPFFVCVLLFGRSAKNTTAQAEAAVCVKTQRFSSRLVFFPFLPIDTFGLEKLVSEVDYVYIENAHLHHNIPSSLLLPESHRKTTKKKNKKRKRKVHILLWFFVSCK